MKKLIAMALALVLAMMTTALAEAVPFSDWLESFFAPQDNPVVQDEPLAEAEVPQQSVSEEPAPEEEVLPEFAPVKAGAHGIYVEKLQTKLIGLGFLTGKADGIFGPKTDAALKQLQKVLGWEETGAIETVEDFDEILAVAYGEGVNLAMGTAVPIELSPTGDNSWCSPTGFYPTSPLGLEYLSDISNKYFTVSFDWEITGADTATDGRICYKHTEKTFADVGSIRIVAGDSNGHFVGTFNATEGMREFGKGWLFSGLGDGNRNINITLSNFMFERGITASAWSCSPEDAGDGINLAMGTGEAVTVSPSGDNSWCSPGGLYPTSDVGLAALSDKDNNIFTVSFDWEITGADTATKGTICLKYTDSKYKSVGEFSVIPGDWRGHFSGSFTPVEGMREYGNGWIISGMGSGNRGIKIKITNFKFERGPLASAWTAAPEDGTEQQ